ncbi:MAG: hypothetical protein E6G40_02190 [Actinobacteria bacterium]|nr:MAG: hypothetical protein E6G40_02190 [Actinomycetota bacterium]
MLEPDAVQAALLAAAGEVQALMNHLGLAARSAPATKLAFEDDVRTSLRKALQFGRVELVTVESSLAATGALAEPTDVVVAAKSKVPQLAIEVQWHPRGEDHSGFANAAMADVVKMAVARTKGVVEQAGVLVAAPARFWRWLPGYSEDRVGYELLGPEEGTPATLKSDFLANSTWDYMFQSGMDHEVPDRLWSSVLGSANLRSPWADMELRLLEVKGLGSARAVR